MDIPTEVTESELINALQAAAMEAAQNRRRAGMTTAELAGVLGITKEQVRLLLRRLIETGKVRPVSILVTGIHGKNSHSYAYCWNEGQNVSDGLHSEGVTE